MKTFICKKKNNNNQSKLIKLFMIENVADNNLSQTFAN